METDGTDQPLILARTADCRAEYSRASDAVQLRFGQADLRLTPAQFLSVCATMLKAARALGQQPYIPGLAPPLAHHTVMLTRRRR